MDTNQWKDENQMICLKAPKLAQLAVKAVFSSHFISLHISYIILCVNKLVVGTSVISLTKSLNNYELSIYALFYKWCWGRK